MRADERDCGPLPSFSRGEDIFYWEGEVGFRIFGRSPPSIFMIPCYYVVVVLVHLKDTDYIETPRILNPEKISTVTFFDISDM